MENQNPRVPPLWEHSLTTLLGHDSTSDPGIALRQWVHFQGVTRFYQCLRLCSCGTKPQRSENHHFVMTSSWEPQCHHDIIMRTPRITGKLKFSCSRGL